MIVIYVYNEIILNIKLCLILIARFAYNWVFTVVVTLISILIQIDLAFKYTRKYVYILGLYVSSVNNTNLKKNERFIP